MAFPVWSIAIRAVWTWRGMYRNRRELRGGGAGGKSTYRYPYKLNDRRENLEASDDIFRIQRGGAFL